MGLLDFFKRKDKFEFDDPNTYFQLKLRKKLREMGYKVNLEDGSLRVNSTFEIYTTIIENPGNHPYIMQLHTVISSNQYLPGGITEDIIGSGKDTRSKVISVFDNFVNVSLPPLLDVLFGDCSSSRLNFNTGSIGKKITWHTKLGDFGFKGEWNEQEQPPIDYLYNRIIDSVKDKLVDRKLNWLKIYLAKRPNGEIFGECTVNNEPWEKGCDLLFDYVNSWPNTISLRSIKQFIFFKRCDNTTEN